MLIIGLALGVILFSLGLGLWLACQAVNPWAHSAMEIRRLEKDGAKYYITDHLTSVLYDLVQKTCNDITSQKLDAARSQIAQGRKLAPDNASFYYLEAVVAAKRRDNAAAVKWIEKGNAAGALHLYASGNLPPDRWQWPEMDAFRYMNKSLVDKLNDRASLMTLLIMGQKMVYCTPGDPVRLISGMKMRDRTARKLLALAEEERDLRLEKMCRELLAENRAFMRILWQRTNDASTLRDASRVWVIGRAAGREHRSIHNAAMLLYLEKQAERADKLRRDYLRKKI